MTRPATMKTLKGELAEAARKDLNVLLRPDATAFRSDRDFLLLLAKDTLVSYNVLKHAALDLRDNPEILTLALQKFENEVNISSLSCRDYQATYEALLDAHFTPRLKKELNHQVHQLDRIWTGSGSTLWNNIDKHLPYLRAYNQKKIKRLEEKRDVLNAALLSLPVDAIKIIGEFSDRQKLKQSLHATRFRLGLHPLISVFCKVFGNAAFLALAFEADIRLFPCLASRKNYIYTCEDRNGEVIYCSNDDSNETPITGISFDFDMIIGVNVRGRDWAEKIPFGLKRGFHYDSPAIFTTLLIQGKKIIVNTHAPIFHQGFWFAAGQQISSNDWERWRTLEGQKGVEVFYQNSHRRDYLTAVRVVDGIVIETNETDLVVV